jgi:hypothetical protein
VFFPQGKRPRFTHIKNWHNFCIKPAYENKRAKKANDVGINFKRSREIARKRFETSSD